MSPDTASRNEQIEVLRDELTGELINLSQVALSVTCDKTMTNALLKGLVLSGRESFPPEECIAQIEKTVQIRNSHGYTCFFQSKEIPPFDMNEIRRDKSGGGSIKMLILDVLRANAALASEAKNLGFSDEAINDSFYKGLNTMAGTLPPEYLTDIIFELGNAHLRAMELLAAAADYDLTVCEWGQTAGLLSNGSVKRIILAAGCAKTDETSNILRDIGTNTIVIMFGCGKMENISAAANVFIVDDCLSAFRALKTLASSMGRAVHSLPLNVLMSWNGAKSAALLFCLISMGIKNIFIEPDFPEIMSTEIINMFKQQYGLNRITDFTA